MLRIRLFRVGKRNQPAFKIVVTERENPPSGGNFLEQVGFWNPLTKERNLKEKRIKHWLSVGAQPSDTVHNMLVDTGIIEGKKKKKHKKAKEEKKGKEKEGEETDKEKEEAPQEKLESDKEGKKEEEEAPDKKEEEEKEKEKEEEVEKKGK